MEPADVRGNKKKIVNNPPVMKLGKKRGKEEKQGGGERDEKVEGMGGTTRDKEESIRKLFGSEDHKN